MNLAPRKRNRFLSLAWLALVTFVLGCKTERTEASALPAESKIESKSALETFDAAWRTIYETHFDPKFQGVDWAAVRDELRPRAAAATSMKALRSVIQEMLDRLGQSHMVVIPRETADVLESESKSKGTRGTANAASKPSARRATKTPATPKLSPADDDPVGDAAGTVGFEARLVENQFLVTRVEPGGPADRLGVKPGWLVEAIDAEPVAKLLEALPDKLDERRKKVMAWTAVTAQLKGAPGSSVRIEFLDGVKKKVALEIKRDSTPGVPAKLGFLPTYFARVQKQRLKAEGGASVGVIRFNIWMFPIAGEFDKAIDDLRDCDGIVLDLRGNIGGVAAMIMGFSGHFLKERISLGTMKTRDLELQLIANPRFVSSTGQRVEPYAGPLAILTDDISLSASEIFAGGMQAVGRARVFGQRTMGAALPSVYERLPNGDVLMHAIGDFVAPSGVRLENRGVTPDEPIALTRPALLAGRDAPLLAAMNWIDKQRRKPTINSRANE